MVGKRIPWWTPEVGEAERSLIEKVLADNYLNDGEYTTRFENEIAARVGAPYAIAVTSGTAALYLSLMALNIGQGDEVIIPDVTFIATANAAKMTGAKVILVDVDPATLTMDPESFRKAITRRTKAVVPVHVSGRGGTILDILEIAGQYGISVVEDAAEALMSKHKGHFLGTLGITGCFSFSPNKTITTGQGGIVVTKNQLLNQRLRELKDQGRSVRGTGGDDLHPALGFNFKMTNLQAAVGLGQINYLEKRLSRQKDICRLYHSELRDTNGIYLLPFSLDEGECPQWTDAIARKRDELDSLFQQQNILCRRFWYPIHTQEPYRMLDDKFPVSTQMSPKALWLPSAFQMSNDDIRRITRLIQKFYE